MYTKFLLLCNIFKMYNCIVDLRYSSPTISIFRINCILFTYLPLAKANKSWFHYARFHAIRSRNTFQIQPTSNSNNSGSLHFIPKSHKLLLKTQKLFLLIKKNSSLWIPLYHFVQYVNSNFSYLITLNSLL